MEINKQKTSIIIADDHELYLDGLVNMFHNEQHYEVLATCRNGNQLIQSTLKYRPDVIITDIHMPEKSGLDAIRDIKKSMPLIGILVLSNLDSEYRIIEALQAGAKGYISKSMSKTDLFDAIEKVKKHEPYLCKSSSSKLTRMIVSHGFHDDAKSHLEIFSPLELQIMQLLCEERTIKEIASTLFKSERTIENHRTKLFEKIKVKSTIGLVVFAVKNGLYKDSK